MKFFWLAFPLFLNFSPCDAGPLRGKRCPVLLAGASVYAVSFRDKRETRNELSGLVASFKNGDLEAGDRLVSSLALLLWPYIERSAPNAQDAEDALQISLLETVQALAGFRQSKRLVSYAFRVAERNLAELANKSVVVAYETDLALNLDTLTAVNQGPGDTLFEEEQNDLRNERIHRALRSIPARERGLIERQHLEGWSGKELADYAGVSPARVAQIVSRGMNRLREYLERYQLVE